MFVFVKMCDLVVAKAVAIRVVHIAGNYPSFFVQPANTIFISSNPDVALAIL